MKNTEAGKILFLYTSGRRDRINKISYGEAPREFLYGYTDFKEAGMDVDYVETDFFYPKWFNRQYWTLKRNNQKFADHLGIGNRSHLFINRIEDFNNYDTLIATTDSIALGLAYHGKNGILDADIIYINMGLAGSLYNLKKRKNGNFRQYKKQCEMLIDHCKSIVSLGKAEFQFFIEEYPHLAEKFIFIPFGVDVDFWTPTDSLSNHSGRFILFVGNDLNRDYDLLLKIAESCPDNNFKFVTSRLKQRQCPNNVTVIDGSLKKYSLSDVELRKLYHRAQMIILPLEETLQPSGQSVALQAMACGKPVIITRTSGLWDPLVLHHNKNLILINKDSAEGFISYIKNSKKIQVEMQDISIAARKTVKNHYRSNVFSDNLMKLIHGT